MLNTALSNAGTIAPLLNSPSEPPLRFDGQLEYLRASVSKLTPRFSLASSSLASFSLSTRMCRAHAVLPW